MIRRDGEVASPPRYRVSGGNHDREPNSRGGWGPIADEVHGRFTPEDREIRVHPSSAWHTAGRLREVVDGTPT